MWSLYSLFVSKHQVSVTKLLPPVSYLNHKQDFRSYILISRHDGISASSQCHTYMLAGGTEPLSIRDQHERRPQTGSVVSTVTRVTQQDLRTHTHIKLHTNQQRWQLLSFMVLFRESYQTSALQPLSFCSCLCDLGIITEFFQSAAATGDSLQTTQ